MENPVYHVLLEGRKIGPYDRRTIVGMRAKKTLTSKDVLEGADGARLTVGDLVRRPPPEAGFDASRSGSYSVVHAMFTGRLAQVAGDGMPVPAFQGEVEVRVQTRVLRISGRFRHGFAWQQGRIKIALSELAHVRQRGAWVDLALSDGEGEPAGQRLTLNLATPDAAADLVAALPPRAPWPDGLLPAPGALARFRWAAAAVLGLGAVGGAAWLLAGQF